MTRKEIEEKMEALDRLEEIKNEIAGLRDETEELLRGYFPDEYEKARSYWLASMETDLTQDHSYLSKSPITFEDSLASIALDLLREGGEEIEQHRYSLTSMIKDYGSEDLRYELMGEEQNA